MGLALLAVSATQLQAKPIKPNQGEGKYRFCQRMYNSCMTGVFGAPGSQSYNVGRARCYGKWTGCRKGGTWQALSASPAFDAMMFADEAGLSRDASDDAEMEADELLEE